MKKSYNSLFNSILFEKFNNKLFLKGKKEKYLKFKTDDKEVVEIRGAEGLNYKIQEM